MKIASLIIDIFKGRHTREEVHDIISYYEKQNPNFFVDYDIKKKEKPWDKEYFAPWDKEYFEALKKRAVAGTSSKQFILHSTDVIDYLLKHKIIKKRDLNHYY